MGKFYAINRLLPLLFGLLAVAIAQNGTATSNNKRGLDYVWPEASSVAGTWTSTLSPITWYYNYQAYPTYGLDEDVLEYVPMMWGNRQNDQGFYDNVKGLIDQGMAIKHVLGFNEPDGCDGGSSCVDAKVAAKAWKKEIEPLKQHGVKLGSPAVRQDGADWLQEFYQHCDGGCTTDFMAVHWYGDATGLGDWVRFHHDTYSNTSEVWVTEFAYPAGSIEAAEQSFNGSVAFMDQHSYVARYAYFGAFTRKEANEFVGPNVAMLDNAGNLTSIGAWYLNLNASYIGTSISAATTLPAPNWNMLVGVLIGALVLGLG